MRDLLLRAQGLTIAFGPHEAALLDVDLEIAPDQLTGIVGPSGSGKTTLLRALTGALDPRETTAWRGRLERRDGLRVGYVPQLETVNWNFPITVLECVALGLPQRGLRFRPSRDERTLALDWLERLGLVGLSGRQIRELSGGQQQRMFLARALVGDPHLLLLDEPTSGVDITTRHSVLHLLADLNSKGRAIVLTTHDLNGMAAHLPHLVCLNRRVVAEGRPVDVITAPVLEETFGAGLDVLTHLGMPVVVDAAVHDR